jgi:hypothetical protein
MKQKEILAFLSGYTLATFLNSDQMVKMGKEYTRKSMAAKVEFGFEFGINSLSIIHLGFSDIKKHKYQRAFAIGYILAMAHCLLNDLFMPDSNIHPNSIYATRKYYFMENKTYQVIFGLLNLSTLFYANSRLNQADQEQNIHRNQRRPRQPARRIERAQVRRGANQYHAPLNQQDDTTLQPSAPRAQIPIAIAINSSQHEPFDAQTNYSTAPIVASATAVPSAPPAPPE